jgi:hypothetical protein
MRLSQFGRAFAAAPALAAVLALGTLTAGAAPTPIPGGANQITAVSGKVGQEVFNGVLRVTVQTVHDATPDDHPETELPGADQKIIVMKVLIKNGRHDSFDYLMEYTLADADSVTKQISQPYIHPANLSIEQGAAARQTVRVPVDKDFHPVKLLIECGGCPDNMHFRSIRLTIP